MIRRMSPFFIGVVNGRIQRQKLCRMQNPVNALPFATPDPVGESAFERAFLRVNGPIRIHKRRQALRPRQSVVRSAAFARVEISRQNHRHFCRLCPTANQLCRLQPRLRAAMVKMRVRKRKRTPFSSAIPQNHPRKHPRQRRIPTPASRQLWSLAQPKMPGIQQRKAIPPIKNRNKLALRLAVISPHSVKTVALEVFLEKLRLKTQHFLRSQQIRAEHLDRLQHQITPMRPTVFPIVGRAKANVEAHHSNRRLAPFFLRSTNPAPAKKHRRQPSQHPRFLHARFLFCRILPANFLFSHPASAIKKAKTHPKNNPQSIHSTLRKEKRRPTHRQPFCSQLVKTITKAVTRTVAKGLKTDEKPPPTNKNRRKIVQSTKKDEKLKKFEKKACAPAGFLIFSLLSVPSGTIRYRVSPLEYHSLICNASGESYALSCWLRQTGGNSRYLLRLLLATGLDAGRGFPKAPAKTQ